MANLEQRIELLEKQLVPGAPMSASDAMRWFVMFCVERGGSFATPHPGFTLEDWTWYHEREADAITTINLMNEKK